MRLSSYRAVIVLSMLVLVAASALAKDRVALVIDKSLYSSNGIAEKIDRYKSDVESRFPVELRIMNKERYEGFQPSELRTVLKKEYTKNHISGAILVGQIRYGVWKNKGQDNEGINSFYYEDLDGKFSDTDGDGYDNLHEWGPHPGPEIWVCWMRPPADTEVVSLNAFLDKTHSFYLGEVAYNSRALIAESKDYDNNIRGSFNMAERLKAIYGENIDIRGEGADLVQVKDQIDLLNKNRYEIYETMSHANTELQAYDDGLLRTAQVRDLTGGAIMAMIYGCYSAAFNLAPNTNIVQAYVFGKGIGQAASGTSWSYGTEGKWHIYEGLAKGDYLGKAWMDMEVVKNTPEYMKGSSPEPNYHLWGDNLMGNPFIRLKTLPVAAKPEKTAANG